MFKLWSESNTEAKRNLKPDLGLRNWNSLSEDEKFLIWKHLYPYFFDIDICYKNEEGYDQKYENNRSELFYFENRESRKYITNSIQQICLLYKNKDYANKFFRNPNHFAACIDFHTIFFEEDENVVIELLSLYCKSFLNEVNYDSYGYKFDDNQNEEKLSKEKYISDRFNSFCEDLNEVFSHFGLNIYLTENGFIPKQDDKIIKEIFEPVLECISDEKWTEVNKLFSDAFAEFRKNSPNSYSTCITHTVSAVQAYLQILVNGKTGVGDISKLIPQAQKENLLPNDMFTKEIFKTIESTLMRERQQKGDAHPKEEYANEGNAKLIINLAMVFLQHCMLK